ncbi:B12-binding domain-containing protein [Amycolatopsis umgeniensis]|uniref:Methanogenic corrinoid protein MtbC1 n=1 Tax=Amycolatopsis umgeniensis TaxID=336628 RepID=A0A841AWB0_9PSEU|nr:cobalamin-dependent protein [Amycolatopsis umgeniensis]MBB5851257.1 methanogenic corrinoid protein MtbC1 [Amycolatopsis umgeniensis]
MADAGTRRSMDALLRASVAGDEPAARQAALASFDSGLDTETVLLEVVGGVQREIGDLWATNRLTVAQEHVATAINERVIVALGTAGHRPRPHLPRVTVACVDGDWHVMAARLLAEVLVLRGFRVDYLGGQVPVPYLLAHLRSTGPEVVALSGSLAPRLPAAHEAIRACRSAGAAVVIGGSAFGPGGRYAPMLGADLWAPGPREAAVELERGFPAVRRPIEDLPGPGEQEYALVTRSHPRLVRSMRAVFETGPRGHRDRDWFLDSLAKLVDFLGAAVYVDDSRVFSDHLDWLGAFLSARGITEGFLGPILAALDTELREFPRALRILSQARSAASGPRME